MLLSNVVDLKRYNITRHVHKVVPFSIFIALLRCCLKLRPLPIVSLTRLGDILKPFRDWLVSVRTSRGECFKMDKRIENSVTCELRTAIRFLNARNIKPADHRQICEIYGENETGATIQ